MLTLYYAQLKRWQEKDCEEKLQFAKSNPPLTDREKEAYRAGHLAGFGFLISCLITHYGVKNDYSPKKGV